MAIIPVNRLIDSDGVVTNTVGTIGSTEAITGVILRKTLTQSQLTQFGDQVVIDNGNNITNLSIPRQNIFYGIQDLRVFIDDHEVSATSTPAGYTRTGGTIASDGTISDDLVITPATVAHPRTVPGARHSPGAYDRVGGASRQVFLIDQNISPEITTGIGGTLITLTIMNTGGGTAISRDERALSTWTADLSTTAGEGTGDGFFTNADTVEATTRNGQRGYLVTFDDQADLRISVSDRYVPPGSISVFTATYTASSTDDGEIVRVEYGSYHFVEVAEVRPTNVTATVTVRTVTVATPQNPASDVLSSPIILLKNGPKGGFSQSFHPNLNTTAPVTQTLRANDVVEALLTTTTT